MAFYIEYSKKLTITSIIFIYLDIEEYNIEYNTNFNFIIITQAKKKNILFGAAKNSSVLYYI